MKIGTTILMERGHFDAVKLLILTRSERMKARTEREGLLRYFAGCPKINRCLKKIQREFPEELYRLPHRNAKFATYSDLISHEIQAKGLRLLKEVDYSTARRAHVTREG